MKKPIKVLPITAKALSFSLLLFFKITTQNTLASETTPDCSRSAGSRPNPQFIAGTENKDIPIEHIFVIMLENHSFDNVLGQLSDPKYYGTEVDGHNDTLMNLDSNGQIEKPFHLAKACVSDMHHGWDESHLIWNNGLNDKFVSRNDEKDKGYRTMGYYDDKDYPLMYSMADQFAVGDRYFSSLLGPTQPNRFYLFNGTSFGQTYNRILGAYKQKTIFETMTENNVDWKFYTTDYTHAVFFPSMMIKNAKHFRNINHLKNDMKKGKLANVVFLEGPMILGDEHPPFSYQSTQHWLSKRIKDIVDSEQWSKSAIFITYDEGGGFYDHVSPPSACAPDDIMPELGKKGSTFDAKFDRLGFRVPFIAISPYAKRHYVSHVTYDHTSILKFIETKYNLPALSRRDANANGLMDMFDFNNPDFSKPYVPEAKVEFKSLVECITKKELRDDTDEFTSSIP